MLLKLSSRELAEDDEFDVGVVEVALLLERLRTKFGLSFFLTGGTGGSSCLVELENIDLRMPLLGCEMGLLSLTEAVVVIRGCCCCCWLGVEVDVMTEGASSLVSLSLRDWGLDVFDAVSFLV